MALPAATYASGAAVVVGTAAALVASRFDRPSAYRVAKAIASAGFVAAGISVGATNSTWSSVALAALVFSAIGDILLAGTRPSDFLGGLGAFALAHATYSAAFLMRGVTLPALAVCVVASAIAMWAAWRWLSPHLSGSLRRLVAAYLVVAGAMLATGIAAAAHTSSWWLAVGVALVPLSDLAVARQRFIARSFANKAWGLPAYYLGQLLIAVQLGP